VVFDLKGSSRMKPFTHDSAGSDPLAHFDPTVSLRLRCSRIDKELAIFVFTVNKIALIFFITFSICLRVELDEAGTNKNTMSQELRVLHRL